MSHGYTSVQWNHHKRVYDLVLTGGIVLFVGAFAGVSLAMNPRITAETIITRGTALACFTLLTSILTIGPLARLDRRFLPLLYNRRHLGVAMFMLALIHAVFSILQFHAFSETNPLVSVFTAYQADYDPFLTQSANLSRFPFEPLGFAALVVLFLMAATSHDFWLKNLGAAWWKKLHLLVLIAYGLIVLHVAFGALQSEQHPVLGALVISAAIAVYGLHVVAARREARADKFPTDPSDNGYLRACATTDLAEGRAFLSGVTGERVAVWLHEGRVLATANVCRHQGGPVGEGQILDGCATCPWHGWQYRPEDGTSPPPFDEKIPTFRVKVTDGTVWVHPDADQPGSKQEGAPVGLPAASPSQSGDFYVGYLPMPVTLVRFLRLFITGTLVATTTLAAGLASLQRTMPSGAFEFGVQRTFEGVLYESPIPLLRVNNDGASSAFLLVGFGKAGLPTFARNQHGRQVSFEGSLIYREQMNMIEMNNPESFKVMDDKALGTTSNAPVPVGPITITGELVDTKCYFGVMKPATGKVHRACAIRCLDGGVPPGILVRTDGDDGVVFMLSGRNGEQLTYDVEWAARHVRAEGELELHDDLPVLRVSVLEPID